MRRIADALSDLIEPVVTGMGYEYVGAEYLTYPKHKLLRVYIDSESGVVVEDCSRVSRQLSGVLDVEDPIAGSYQLEVSSPGVERPLFTLAHFERYKDSMVSVELTAPVEARRKLKGKLLGHADGNILIEEQQKLYAIPYEKVKKANLVVDFQTIGKR